MFNACNGITPRFKTVRFDPINLSAYGNLKSQMIAHLPPLLFHRNQMENQTSYEIKNCKTLWLLYNTQFSFPQVPNSLPLTVKRRKNECGVLWERNALKLSIVYLGHPMSKVWITPRDNLPLAIKQ